MEYMFSQLCLLISKLLAEQKDPITGKGFDFSMATYLPDWGKYSLDIIETRDKGNRQKQKEQEEKQRQEIIEKVKNIFGVKPE